MVLLVAAGLLPVASLEFALAAEGKAEPERVALWPDKAPVGDGTFSEDKAFITVHRPSIANGTAVVICPGGGYGGLVTGPEGTGIARWLNRCGITGIVLEYRLPGGRSFVPMLDVQRAIRTARANAAAWGCDPARIGVMGFSAGGHLASTAATHFDDGDPKSADPVAKAGCRPDFAILIYPVISMGPQTHAGTKANLLGGNPTQEMIDLFSNEKRVSDKTCPAFLAHAVDDTAVSCDNSRQFYEALKARKVAARYLELPSGGHGLNGYQGPMWDAWQTESLKWLEEQKIIPTEDSIKDARSGATGEEEGFIPLFNGKDLEGWEGADWVVEDGVMVCRGGNLTYVKDEFANFILRFDLKLSPSGNNGLNIRTDGAIWNEIQVLDDEHPMYANIHPYQAHGSIYGVVPAKRGFLKPAGEWNSQEVMADGSRIRVTLNGTVIVDADLSKLDLDKCIDGNAHPGLRRTSGRIGWLGHPNALGLKGAIFIRNIRIKKLP